MIADRVRMRKVGRGVPGNRNLIYGNMSDGYFGEVSANRFITGDALASELNLTGGISHYSDSDWFKVAIDNKIMFVPKKPLRYSVTAEQLNAVGAVMGVNIIIKGVTYMVRLIKGDVGGDYGRNPIQDDSEWGRIIYRLIEGVWGNYTQDDLVAYRINDTDSRLFGSSTWCQEEGISNTRIIRGGISYRFFSAVAINNPHISVGWRPILEVVQ